MDHSWAVDQVDTLHEGDILPDLGFTGDGCDVADLLAPKGVDDAGFTSVGVADKANRDLLLVRVKGRELTKQLNQGSFAKRVVDRRVKGESRVFFGQCLDPFGLESSCRDKFNKEFVMLGQ